MDCHTNYLRAAVLALAVAGGTGFYASAAPLGLLNKKQEPKFTPKASTVAAFAKCLECDAENPGLNSSDKQKLLDIARGNYQKAIEMDPTHLPAYTGLGRVYTNMNHYDKALATYQRALQKFPKNASLWFEVGLSHCRLKEWELAIRGFQKALESQPESRAVIQALGFCQARAGRLQESVQTLSKVMSPAEASYNVARMLHHMKHDDLSRRYLSQALQLNPELAGAQSLQAALTQPNRPEIHFEP
jgi:tetratricopeptide (TPR) repeat protein